MNSSFQLVSEKTKGSTFSFIIATKWQLPQYLSPILHHLGSENALHGMKVLLAEDNQVNVSIARQLLGKWAIQVNVANNGEEAVTMAKQNEYDVMLMDLHMPIMNGIEATRLIRETKKRLPIIALTADAISESKEECLTAGMNDFITKPFNPDELFSKLFLYKSN